MLRGTLHRQRSAEYTRDAARHKQHRFKVRRALRLQSASVALCRPTGLFNCCGFGKNISRYGDAAFHCLDPSIVVSGRGGSHG